MTTRLSAAFILAPFIVGGLLATGACAPGVTADSSLPNFTDTTQGSNLLYAINPNPPAGAPTAVALFDGASVRADQAFAYDFAVDIDSVGQAVIYPVSKLATSISNVRRIGMQIMAGPYSVVETAPRNGYAYDSTFHVPVGTILAIESSDPINCGTSITGSGFYSKLQVDSVNTIQRTVRLIFTVDRNCGFRSLIPTGVPGS